MKKSLYLCSANPQWGSASGGAVVRSAANKSFGGQADMLKKAFVEALF